MAAFHESPLLGARQQGGSPEGGGAAASPDNFAKLFDTPHGQLLVYLDGDEDCDPIIVVVGAPVRGVVPKANLGYDSYADRLSGFARFTQERAEETAASLHATADRYAEKSA